MLTEIGSGAIFQQSDHNALKKKSTGSFPSVPAIMYLICTGKLKVGILVSKKIE